MNRLIGPAVGHSLPREQAPDDLKGFGEATEPIVERDPESGELRLIPPSAEPHDEPSAGQLIDRRRDASEHSGTVKRGARDERANADPLSHRGKPGQQRPRVPRPALRASVITVEEVIPHPHGVKPHLLSGASHHGVLRPTDDALDLWELNSDTERAHAQVSLGR